MASPNGLFLMPTAVSGLMSEADSYRCGEGMEAKAPPTFEFPSGISPSNFGNQPTASSLIPSLLSMGISCSEGTAVECDVKAPIKPGASVRLHEIPSAPISADRRQVREPHEAKLGDPELVSAVGRSSRCPESAGASSLRRMANRQFNRSDALVSYCEVVHSTAEFHMPSMYPHLKLPSHVPLGKPLLRDDGLILVPTIHLTAEEAFANGVLSIQTNPDNLASNPSGCTFVQLPPVAHTVEHYCNEPHAITMLDWCNNDHTVAAALICRYICMITVPRAAGPPSTAGKHPPIPIIKPLEILYQNGSKCLAGHSDTARVLRVHPSSGIMISGSVNGEILCIDLSTCSQVYPLRNIPGTISDISFGSEGDPVVQVMTEQGKLFWLDMQTGAVPMVVEVERPAIFSGLNVSGLGYFIAHGDGRVNILQDHRSCPRGFWDPVVSAVDEVQCFQLDEHAWMLLVTGFEGASCYYLEKDGSGEMSAQLRAVFDARAHDPTPCPPRQIMSISDYPLEPKLSVAFMSHRGESYLVMGDSFGWIRIINCAAFALGSAASTALLCIEAGEVHPDIKDATA